MPGEIDGVIRVPLTAHDDARGSLTEVFRTSWSTGVNLLQWNMEVSRACSLRGVHVHLDHDDFVVIASGRFTVGLVDARDKSRTSGASMLIEMEPSREAIVIPAGVAHGFYAHDDGVMLVGVTQEWSPLGTLRCRYDDPALRLQWPSTTPILSDQDRDAPPFSEMRDAVRAAFAPAESE